MPFNLAAIDHVQLAMPPGGEDAAEAFYGDLLGLDVVPKPEPLASRGGRWFESGCVRLHLGVESSFRAARKAHPALVVDHLDDLIGVFDSAGISVVWDRELPETRRCFVDDPFGNRIELIDG